jgi:hypothetical protein
MSAINLKHSLPSEIRIRRALTLVLLDDVVVRDDETGRT